MLLLEDCFVGARGGVYNSSSTPNHVPVLSHMYAHVYASVFDKEKERSGNLHEVVFRQPADMISK